jgi:uncharacterized membrane protein HdeD (DUF308 family)
MSTQVSPPRPLFPLFPLGAGIAEDLRGLRGVWIWFVLLGVSLVVLGVAAVAYAEIVGITTALLVGFVLVVSGLIQIAGAFLARGWGGFFLSLLGGVLSLALGVILIDHPVDALILYTLLLAVCLFVEGLFRIAAALVGRFHNWGWVLASGVVTLLLGVMIWKQWPFSGLEVVGIFVGVNMICNGLAYVTLGLSARKLPVF